MEKGGGGGCIVRGYIRRKGGWFEGVWQVAGGRCRYQVVLMACRGVPDAVELDLCKCCHRPRRHQLIYLQVGGRRTMNLARQLSHSLADPHLSPYPPSPPSPLSGAGLHPREARRVEEVTYLCVSFVDFFLFGCWSRIACVRPCWGMRRGWPVAEPRQVLWWLWWRGGRVRWVRGPCADTSSRRGWRRGWQNFWGVILSARRLGF